MGLDPDRLYDALLDTSAVHAFVELHIEQAGVLEAAGTSVGAVTHIAAPHDLLVRISRTAAHAGATPMSLRRDAFAGAQPRPDHREVDTEGLQRSVVVVDDSPNEFNITSHNTDRAEPGMAFVLHAQWLDPMNSGANIGDCYLVTGTGYEKLTRKLETFRVPA